MILFITQFNNKEKINKLDYERMIPLLAKSLAVAHISSIQISNWYLNIYYDHKCILQSTNIKHISYWLNGGGWNCSHIAVYTWYVVKLLDVK